MKTSKGQGPASTAKPVEVTITVRKFQEVLEAGRSRGGCPTEYTMKLGRKDPRVVIKGENIIVKPPGAPLRFTLRSAAADKKNYYPVGIAFVREGERSDSDELRLGLVNFPQSETRLAEQTLAILDSYKDDAGSVRYKFSVVVQRGSDGAIGIIDPGIVHENTH